MVFTVEIKIRDPLNTELQARTKRSRRPFFFFFTNADLKNPESARELEEAHT